MGTQGCTFDYLFWVVRRGQSSVDLLKLLYAASMFSEGSERASKWFFTSKMNCFDIVVRCYQFPIDIFQVDNIDPNG